MAAESRRILHIDMDAFYASVEQREHPEWKGRPLIVAGDAARRGVVAAASYEARAYGIHSAMPTALALRACPKVIRVPPRMSLYKSVSRMIFAIFADYTELIEPLSLDESFLDVSDYCRRHSRTAVAVAREIKARILTETSLTATAGVAACKFVAKVASAHRKPDGLTVVTPDRVSEFLAPLPLEKMFGVGPVTATRLRSLGLQTIGDLAAAPEGFLSAHLGRHGDDLQRLARGEDDREVTPDREPQSISAEETFASDVTELSDLEQTLRDQADEVLARVARCDRLGYTVNLKVRYSDFTTVTRSLTLSRPVRTPEQLVTTALELLRARTEALSRPVRLVGLGLSGLREAQGPQQLELFDHI